MKRLLSLLTAAASPLVAAQGVLTKGVDPRERPATRAPVRGNGSVPSDLCKKTRYFADHPQKARASGCLASTSGWLRPDLARSWFSQALSASTASNPVIVLDGHDQIARASNLGPRGTSGG